VESNNNVAYNGLYSYAKNNNTNKFDFIIHKDYGYYLFVNGELIGSDTSINGTWTAWPSNPLLQFYTKHDAGEESHVKLHSIEFRPHPLDIDWFQSNPIEFLTDTLSPSGSEYTGTEVIHSSQRGTR